MTQAEAARSRRRRHRVLRALLAGVLLFSAADTGMEWRLRTEFPTTTTLRGPVDDDLARTFPHTYWVFLPGFGIDFCPDVARALRPVTSRTGQSFCVAPSPVALDAREIAAAVRERVEGDRDTWPDPEAQVTLYVYGISMGGMVGLDLARLLDDDDRIRVGAVVFDSSPAGTESVKGAGQVAVYGGSTINRLPNLPFGIPNPLKGGPLTRFVVHLAEAGAQARDQGRLPGWADARFAWYKATRVVATNATNQLSYIAGFGAATGDPVPDAAYGYLGAADPAADDTVDVGAAVAGYRRLLDPYDLHVLPIVGGRHASANETPDAYRAALAVFAREAGLPTADDVARERARAEPVSGRR